MTRKGSHFGMLDNLHEEGCDGTEYSACRPVVRDGPDGPGDAVQVIIMAWCGDCGAAEWDYV